MSKLRVSSFAVSIDDFGAGASQDLENPIGVGELALMDWFFPTRTWQHMHGNQGGETGVDDGIAAEGLAVLLGVGEALWAGIDLPALGYESVKSVAGEHATHVFLRRRV
jgi:hypothetical protein